MIDNVVYRMTFLLCLSWIVINHNLQDSKLVQMLSRLNATVTRLDIKTSYRYRKSHVKDMTISRLFHP